MKHAKRILIALAVALLAGMVSPAGAYAKHLKGGSKWTATYTKRGRMTDNYSEKEFIDQVSHLQPGDDITFTVKAVHENDTEADWYIANDVIQSLEDSVASAEGSNYEYVLTWKGPKQSRTLYDSEHVGGDVQNAGDPEGLNEATDALDEFIFLEQMKKGDKGTITLKVTLDGETEGNAYFDSLAQVKIRFGVEPITPERVRRERPTNDRIIVRTGDETRLFPFYVAMALSGIALMGLVVWSIRDRRKDREEALR